MASGGTINFSGAIVAVPFNVTSSSTEPAGGSAGATDASPITIRFAPGSNNFPHADIALLTMRSTGSARRSVAASPVVDATFTQASGQRSMPDRRGNFHVGASGGVLSLKVLSKAGALRPMLATVVSNYL